MRYVLEANKTSKNHRKNGKEKSFRKIQIGIRKKCAKSGEGYKTDIIHFEEQVRGEKLLWIITNSTLVLALVLILVDFVDQPGWGNGRH